MYKRQEYRKSINLCPICPCLRVMGNFASGVTAEEAYDAMCFVCLNTGLFRVSTVFFRVLCRRHVGFISYGFGGAHTPRRTAFPGRPREQGVFARGHMLNIE